MPSWNDLKTYAREEFSLRTEEEDGFSILFALPNGRDHLVRVRRFTAFEEDWVEFSAPVCRVHEMAPVTALKKNAQFVIGALAIRGEHYLLLHNAPLGTMDSEEFMKPLLVLATEGDRMEFNATEEDDY